MTDEQQNYLNELRESGEINMFEAFSCLEEEFDIDENKAKKVLLTWMETRKV